MGNRTNYGTGRMTVDNRQKNERSRSGNPYSSHVKAGKHAGTVYNFKRKSRIRKSLTRLPILLEFIHKYIFLNFVSFYNGLNSNLLSKLHEAKHHVNVRLDMDELDLTAAESKATYEEIRKYVAEHYDGMKVSNLYIAQVKAKYGIIERENYNKAKSDDARQPKCPKEKEEAIVEALKAFKMI